MARRLWRSFKIATDLTGPDNAPFPLTQHVLQQEFERLGWTCTLAGRKFPRRFNHQRDRVVFQAPSAGAIIAQHVVGKFAASSLAMKLSPSMPTP